MGLLDIIEKNKEENGEETTTQQQKKVEEVKEVKAEDPYDSVKKKIHGRIILALNRAGKATVDRDEMEKLLTEEVDKDEYNIPRVERKPIVKTLLDDILGYGPIQDLIDSDSCSEIMVNGPDRVYIEQKGKLVLTDIKFRDEEHLMNIIDRIVTQVGRHVDEASPMVDARLPDGSRVNAIIPPISLIGAVLTIRKFSSTPVTAAQLVEWGSLNPVMLSFLEACVKGKLNIVVSGGTGSGKTTLLKTILGLLKPVSGELVKGDFLQIGYFAQEDTPSNSETALDYIWNEYPAMTNAEVRAALARCGLTNEHITSQMRVLSGGENAKVRLCKLMQNKYNVLVLDEPTNHLDIYAKEELSRALRDFKGTIVLVSHEPEFYQGWVTDIWNIEDWTTKIV